MKMLNEWFSEEETKEFVKQDLHLIKAEEDAGWVDFYFKYNGKEFTVTQTLVVNDLSNIVQFFEELIDLKEDVAVFLNDELISVPLLYAEPVSKSKIRFLVADAKRSHDMWEKKEVEEYLDTIFKYDIKCDIVIDKNTLLKEFYRAIKNIILFTQKEDFFNINYITWKDKLKHIITYLNNNNLL